MTGGARRVRATGSPAGAVHRTQQRAAELAERLVEGDRRALARALTLIEDAPWRDDGGELLRALIGRVHPHTGTAAMVGVTGAPGVGKSSLTSALVAAWRQRDARVAVLAVDPSSPFTGGALLGDRVRMSEHVLDAGVFVRSMASRGHLGGLSWSTPQALSLLDAAGFDVVLLETVGVGQAEVEVAGVTDTTVVVMAPGMGDAVQAAKAGILEVADVFAVNKADHDGADRTRRELREMQQLGHGDWLAPVVMTVATAGGGPSTASGSGIEDLLDAVERHRTWLIDEDRLTVRRQARARLEIREIALAELRAAMGELAGGGIDELAARVAARSVDPYQAADAVVAGVRSSAGHP